LSRFKLKLVKQSKTTLIFGLGCFTIKKYDMKNYIILLLALFLLSACQEEKKSTEGKAEKSVKEIKSADKISSIIRNPVTADNNMDTVNVAKITFDQTTYDFGTVKEGAEVEHTFSFTNTGKVNLLISNAKSTCGCTVPKWPDYPIAPGKSDKIKVVFKTAGKKDFQNKPVTIFANTFPNETKVYIKGNVIAAEGK
jgi:uncharacterized cupredoxin-like copper-binding protein